MTVLDFDRTSRSPVSRIATFFVDMAASFARWNKARATRNMLTRLSDKELDDIGLCRGDIDRIVTRN